MKKILVSSLLIVSLLLCSCVFEPAYGDECGFCDRRYTDVYCPVHDGTCPKCTVEYGETCAVCGTDCCFHYIELGDQCTFLCYSCAEDLLNDPSVYPAAEALLSR